MERSKSKKGSVSSTKEIREKSGLEKQGSSRHLNKTPSDAHEKVKKKKRNDEEDEDRNKSPSSNAQRV